MSWFDELGFKNNPLDVRPNPKLVGLEREEKQLINHILKEEICFLNGLTGSGKTSMLMRIQEKLSDHKFIYLDAHELPKDFNLEKELMDQRGFFDRLMLKRFPKKKPVLIIDEFQSTDPDLVLEARASWENPIRRKVKAIIIAQISKYLKNVTRSFKERLGSRIITLRPLDEDEMKEMLMLRLKINKKVNFAEKLSDDAISFIVKCSGNNPRRLLEYADELFDFHHIKFAEKNPILKKDYQITYHGAREILGLEKVKVEGFEHLDIEDDRGKDVAKFERLYTVTERKILRFTENKPKTLSEISKRLKVSSGTAMKLLAELRRKRAIVFAGKKNRKKLWQVAPAVKRLLVKV